MEGCLKELKDEFKCDKFSLSSQEPGRFTRSQWCPEEKCSLWYLIYRWAMATIFVITIFGHISHVSGEWGGAAWKWIIFMTDQGISILCIHYVFEALLVTHRYINDKRNGNNWGMTLPLTHKISWVMGNTSFTVALLITLVYWTLLHPYVLESNMLKTNAAVAFNFFMHAVNTISVLIDFFISDRPWRILHFYFPVLFGIWYLLFSLIYWAAGGTGFCLPNESNEIVCNSFIYPILDYSNHPGLAVGIILGGTLFLPFLHTFYFFLHQLRLRLHAAIYPKVESHAPTEVPFIVRN